LHYSGSRRTLQGSLSTGAILCAEFAADRLRVGCAPSSCPPPGERTPTAMHTRSMWRVNLDVKRATI